MICGKSHSDVQNPVFVRYSIQISNSREADSICWLLAPPATSANMFHSVYRPHCIVRSRPSRVWSRSAQKRRILDVGSAAITMECWSHLDKEVLGDLAIFYLNDAGDPNNCSLRSEFVASLSQHYDFRNIAPKNDFATKSKMSHYLVVAKLYTALWSSCAINISPFLYPQNFQ